MSHNILDWITIGVLLAVGAAHLYVRRMQKQIKAEIAELEKSFPK